MIKAIKTTAPKHEKLVERIADIVACLYQGVQIDKLWIMDRFHVTERTAYRDIDRLSNILEETHRPGVYQLSQNLQPHMHVSELQSFAHYTNVANIFPNTSGGALKLATQQSENTSVHGYTSRDNRMFTDLLKEIKTAISTQSKLRFIYLDKVREVEPYKLINHNGLWYLAAVDAEKLKSFEIGKIINISTANSSPKCNARPPFLALQTPPKVV
ncbi:MAG: helix-turn-helix transcriptional regulator [Aeromonas sp.]